MFRAAAPLKDKLHDSLQRITAHVMAKIISKQVTEVVDKTNPVQLYTMISVTNSVEVAPSLLWSYGTNCMKYYLLYANEANSTAWETATVLKKLINTQSFWRNKTCFPISYHECHLHPMNKSNCLSKETFWSFLTGSSISKIISSFFMYLLFKLPWLSVTDLIYKCKKV